MDTATLAIIGYTACLLIFSLGGTLVDAKVRRSGANSVQENSSGMVAIRLSFAGLGVVTLMVIGSLLTN